MSDPIHCQFVEYQRHSAWAFAAANPDLCEILALPDPRFLVHFKCPVLVKRPGENPVLANGCDVGITFGPDYCRRADMGVATMLTPFVFHPNIIGGAMCLGRIAPATPLADILVQIYEMLIWISYAPHDCLNPDAAQWVRNNPERVPLETGRSVRIPKPEEVHP
jgi:hypothetical protein